MARMRPAKRMPFQCMGKSTRIDATWADSESRRSKLWNSMKDRVAMVAPSTASWRWLGRSLAGICRSGRGSASGNSQNISQAISTVRPAATRLLVTRS
ncbi:hypothetical protein D3C71_2023010 [compost metagenome]